MPFKITTVESFGWPSDSIVAEQLKMFGMSTSEFADLIKGGLEGKSGLDYELKQLLEKFFREKRLHTSNYEPSRRHHSDFRFIADVVEWLDKSERNQGLIVEIESRPYGHYKNFIHFSWVIGTIKQRLELCLYVSIENILILLAKAKDPHSSMNARIF